MNTHFVSISLLTAQSETRVAALFLKEGWFVGAAGNSGNMTHADEKFVGGHMVLKVENNLKPTETVPKIRELLLKAEIAYFSVFVCEFISNAAWYHGNVLKEGPPAVPSIKDRLLGEPTL